MKLNFSEHDLQPPELFLRTEGPMTVYTRRLASVVSNIPCQKPLKSVRHDVTQPTLKQVCSALVVEALNLENTGERLPEFQFIKDVNTQRRIDPETRNC